MIPALIWIHFQRKEILKEKKEDLVRIRPGENESLG